VCLDQAISKVERDTRDDNTHVSSSSYDTHVSSSSYQAISKVERDTRDDKLLARCYDLLAAARERLAGDKLWTTPGAPNASAHAGTLAGGPSGQSGPRPAGV